LTFNRSDTLVHKNIIAGTGIVAQGGAGTTIITNDNNSYTGGTRIDGGVLLAANTGSLTPFGSGAVNVNNGGTLGGNNGGALPAIVVNSGGTLAPGGVDQTDPDNPVADPAKTGQLKVGNNVTFNSGSAFKVKIQGTSAGGGFDQLFLTGGNINLDGALTATFAAGSFTPDGTEKLFIINNTGGGTLSGTFSNFPNNGDTVASFGGFDWHIYYSADAGSDALTGGNDVVITPVPEPAYLLLVGLAGLAAARLILNRPGHRAAPSRRLG
jgi:fibronectin-binding autotransporter adhesin